MRGTAGGGRRASGSTVWWCSVILGSRQVTQRLLYGSTTTSYQQVYFQNPWTHWTYDDDDSFVHSRFLRIRHSLDARNRIKICSDRMIRWSKSFEWDYSNPHGLWWWWVATSYILMIFFYMESLKFMYNLITFKPSDDFKNSEQRIKFLCFL